MLFFTSPMSGRLHDVPVSITRATVPAAPMAIPPNAFTIRFS